MSKRTDDAVEILKARLIGDDEERRQSLEEELVNAEVAAQIYRARKAAGLTQTQLAGKLGTSQSVVSRLEDADYEGHSLTMLKRIADALGMKIEVKFRDGHPIATSGSACEDAMEHEQFIDVCPATEMHRRGWIRAWQTAMERREVLRSFLGSRPKPVACLRSSGPNRAHDASMVCWLTKLEAEAEGIDVPEFDAEAVRKELPELVFLSAKAEGPLAAVGWLEQHGLRCVFIRHLPKTYLDGGVMLLDDGKPAVGLTLRQDRLDNFWFTLLHEIGHVLRHAGDLQKNPILDERIESPSGERMERQADRFACDAWVSPTQWGEFRRSTGTRIRNSDIESFAADLGVSSALVAGRLRHELQRFTHYRSFLGAGTVKDMIAKEYLIY